MLIVTQQWCADTHTVCSDDLQLINLVALFPCSIPVSCSKSTKTKHHQPRLTLRHDLKSWGRAMHI